MGRNGIQRKMDDKNAVCPFFLYHTQETIICEGVIPDTRARNLFSSEEKKRTHFRLFCCGRWRNCELCSAIMRKYDDE